MPNPLTIANVWRVLRDVNLDAIRASAEAVFVLPIVADEIEDARRLAALLSPGGEEERHPWLVDVRAADGMPALPKPPAIAILVSRNTSLSSALTHVRSSLVRAGARIVTIVLSDSSRAPIAELEESVRLTSPAIDSWLARDVARTLAEIAGPDARLALARQLPPVRSVTIDAIIEETAQANAGYALATGLAEIIPVLSAPLNLSDVVILTKNQLVMSYRIALAAGVPGEARKLIPEILGVLGGGLLFRQIARELIGLVPILGLVPKVAVAYGGTYAIGRAIAGWALEGREISADTFKSLSRDGLDRGRQLARGLLAKQREMRARHHEPTADPQ